MNSDDDAVWDEGQKVVVNMGATSKQCQSLAWPSECLGHDVDGDDEEKQSGDSIGGPLVK